MESSRCFFARINSATVDAAALQEWATKKCTDSTVVRDEAAGDLLLFCMQPQARTIKSFKLMLRNFAQNTKCDLGKLDDFQLLSEEQFKKPKAEPPVSPKESGKRLPQLPDDNAEVEIVDSLPVNFDVLARKRYEKICAISVN